MPPGTHVMMPKQCVGCIDMGRGNPASFIALSVISPWRKKSMTDKSRSRACQVKELSASLLKSAFKIACFPDFFQLYENCMIDM